MKKPPSSGAGKAVKSLSDTRSATETKETPVASSARRRVQPIRAAKGSEEQASSDVFTAMHSRSAEPRPNTGEEALSRVRFGMFQPDAREVFVAGSFNNWNPRATPMRRDSIGDWSVEVRLPPGEYRYRFLVDGEWRDDPSAQVTAMNSFGGFDAVVSV